MSSSVRSIVAKAISAHLFQKTFANLLEVMAQREAMRLLTGRVEVDDTYLGGKLEVKAGRGCEKKVPFVAAVQTNQKGHLIAVRLDRVKGFSMERIEAWARMHWQHQSYGVGWPLVLSAARATPFILKNVGTIISLNFNIGLICILI